MSSFANLLKASIVLGVILSSFVISSKSISLTVKRFKARSRTLCPLRMKRYSPTLQSGMAVNTHLALMRFSALRPKTQTFLIRRPTIRSCSLRGPRIQTNLRWFNLRRSLMSNARVLKSRIVEAACRTDFLSFFQLCFHILEPVEDHIGMLLGSAEKWAALILPAVAEKNEPIPIGPGRWHLRRVGDLLHPEQQKREFLEALRSQDPETYAAQYQQSPIPPGGFMIKRDQI